MSTISEQEIIDYVEAMPAFPKSVNKVINLTSNMDSSAKDIVAAIEGDPVMTVKILKVINSAFYNLQTKVSSVQRALVIIGINTIKNLAISVAIIGILKPYKTKLFDTDLFLEHSLATAFICKSLAERQGISALHSTDYFIAGLLHDFGKIVFAERFPERFNLALEESSETGTDLSLLEVTHLGINHAQVGYMLAVKWELPEELAKAIEEHHKPASNLFGHCLFAANQMAKQGELGTSGNPVIEPFPTECIELFGADLDDLIEELGGIPAIKSTVQQLIGV